MRRKYKFIIDVLLNMIATALPLVILQIMILPNMAKTLSENQYGYLLAVVSLVTIISNTLGNSLNNVRLLNQNEYVQREECGDFNYILLIEELINIVGVGMGVIFLGEKLSNRNIVLIILYSSFVMAREYYIVAFRLKMNYLAIVWNNCFLALGYIVGYFVYVVTNCWIAPYLFGFFLSFFHAIYKNELIREPFAKTKFLKNSFYKVFILCAAGFLSNALTYSDRLFIYPMLGGEAVAIYFAASFLGKIVSTAIGPVVSVILSYLSKENTFPQKQFTILLFASGGVGIVGYFVGIVISKPLLSVLYPMWLNEAMKYIGITTMTAMVIMCINMIKPFVLRYCNINWQITTSLIPFLVYIGLALVLFPVMGLYGFCISVLVSNLLKLIIFCVISMREMRYEV